jgi:hypothetical protein
LSPDGVCLERTCVSEEPLDSRDRPGGFGSSATEDAYTGDGPRASMDGVLRAPVT